MASIVLIPNAAGDETAIPTLVGAATHWQANVSQNADASYVASSGTAFTRDLFNLENSGLADKVISKVTVRAYVRGSVAGTGTAKTSIKTNGVAYDGVAQNVGTAYAIIDTDYTVNPQTGLAWTWAQIDALQAGVVLKRPAVSQTTRCTYILVIVYFTIGTQTFYPITPVEVTPGTAGSWQDVDVSASVPAGATGVVLHLTTNYDYKAYAIGARKNGSTDARIQAIGDSSYIAIHGWAAIGVDASRIFEAYVEHATRIDIFLVGYTMSGVTFFTNAYDKSLSTTGAWTDIDCHTEAPNAIGLVFENVATTGTQAGLRQNGSSDNRHGVIEYHSCFGVIIGCDASQISEGWIYDTNADFFLVGYITDGATFNTNATDVSLGETGTWTDLTALPANSVMGFIEIASVYTPGTCGLRKNGSAEEIYRGTLNHPWAFVECDASQIIEGKIKDTGVDFFVVGYATAAAAITGIPVISMHYMLLAMR